MWQHFQSLFQSWVPRFQNLFTFGALDCVSQQMTIQVTMSPTGGETSNRNVEISYQLQSWSRRTKIGIAFDSSGGFKLPNGADRSPDAVKRERWESLTPEQQRQFVPLCPDFVIELRSPSDDLKPLREKMQEYQENGAQLGWLIDRQTRTVEIYRPLGSYPDLPKG